MVSIADPAAIPTVYPTRPGFPKGDFYRTLMPYTRKGGALPAVFNTRDENLHKQLKSPIAPLFSQSNVLQLEVFVDQVLEVMFHQLDTRFVQSQETFDLANWLQYFAFDVMGTLTFSKRYGFLEQGRDVGGMLRTIWTYMKTAAPMTQIPWLDQLWYKNPWIAMWRRTTGFSILKIVGEFIQERQQQVKQNGGLKEEEQLSHRDMLSRFMEIQATNDSVPPWAITAWTFSNVIAGSDSTGVILRTVWYNLLAHPETLRRLYEELIETEKQNGLTRPFPTWKEVRDLPYLDACINEAIRLHPPFCLPFERVVPKGGITICGQYFPEGTVVGMSPYVVNRHRATFGEDADEWNPDRWLGKGEEHRKKLEQSVLTFGAGRRICLGRYIAWLEMKKLVPALLLNYEFEILDPRRYKVENAWFFRQYGLDVKVKKRVVAT
ncbi:hypothetical protein VTN77DRAFT_537 [Rasamsonia byssochlamydoides]|uniref:uncharacterized protein n=1 Tax=Rasamsonia byssochlamydoides TaxID=89139 RepID=UPI003742AF05